MVRSRHIPRLLAALIVLSALIGLAVQFGVSFGMVGSVAGALWAMIRYFTIVSNLLAAVVFAGVALGRPGFRAPALLGGITLTLLLVAVVYHLLLGGLRVQSQAEILSDIFVHSVTPALVLLFWLVCAPRGGLHRRHVPVWAALPVLYFVYALARGALDGIYPYPFLDVARFGWARVAANAVAIALGFLGAGAVLVWFDRQLAGRKRSGTAADSNPPTR